MSVKTSRWATSRILSGRFKLGRSSLGETRSYPAGKAATSESWTFEWTRQRCVRILNSFSVLTFFGLDWGRKDRCSQSWMRPLLISTSSFVFSHSSHFPLLRNWANSPLMNLSPLFKQVTSKQLDSYGFVLCLTLIYRFTALGLSTLIIVLDSFCLQERFRVNMSCPSEGFAPAMSLCSSFLAFAHPKVRYLY